VISNFDADHARAATRLERPQHHDVATKRQRGADGRTFATRAETLAVAVEAQSPTSQADGDHHRPFGGDTFGIQAERFARFFGTPTFILGQTGLVALWILLNALAITNAIAWDKYPFIALNLAFSLQAAYAAPLILLAQTRQADRDKVRDTAVQAHREIEAKRASEYETRQAALLADDKALAQQHSQMLEQNTELTQQVAQLTADLHNVICVHGRTVAPDGDRHERDGPQPPG
jgi:uncharacterized membrane protein